MPATAEAGQATGAAAVTQLRHTDNHTVVVLPTVGPVAKTMVHNMVAMGVVLRTTIRYVPDPSQRPMDEHGCRSKR